MAKNENSVEEKTIDLEALKTKYGIVSVIETELTPNDEETIERKYYITKVPVLAVSRYLKTGSNSQEKAAKSFVLDCICAESKELLMSDLEQYPLLALSITEKILTSQGFSKTTVLKKLA